MLDMKFVRNNPEVVKENIRRKFQDQKLPLVDEVIEFDRKYRAAKTRCDELRNQRNVISKQIGGMMAQGRKEEAEAAKAQVKAMADEMARLEEDEKVFAEEVKKRMMVIPNIIDPSVPIGKDDSENVELERFGDPVVPDFPVPYHVDIMESLDGIDLDWEFPVSGGKEGTGHRHQDGENYSRLLWELRQALDAKGREEGRQYLLSAAVPLGKEFLSNNSPAALAEPVDYLFLMGYDLHGPWSDAAGFNAPLADLREGTLPYTASVREGVEGWLRAGVPAEKLVLGMPRYGYRYQLAPGQTGPGSRFLSARSASYDRIVAEDLSRYPRSFQDTAQVPYLLGEGWFISYDDPSSIAAKARFAREKGLGGIGFWELSQDRGARLVAAGAAAWENVQNTP